MITLGNLLKTRASQQAARHQYYLQRQVNRPTQLIQYQQVPTVPQIPTPVRNVWLRRIIQLGKLAILLHQQYP